MSNDLCKTPWSWLAGRPLKSKKYKYDLKKLLSHAVRATKHEVM